MIRKSSILCFIYLIIPIIYCRYFSAIYSNFNLVLLKFTQTKKRAHAYMPYEFYVQNNFE